MGKRACRKGRHNWGMWYGGYWHGLPLWRTSGVFRVVCKHCPASGSLMPDGSILERGKSTGLLSGLGEVIRQSREAGPS